MEPGTLEKRGKFLVGGLMVAILAFTLIYLQGQFDKGDLDRAINLLMSKPPGSSWSVAEELNERSGPGLDPQCEPRILSSFAGTMEVTCSAGATYKFAIDLVRKTVQPVDEPTRELISAVQVRNQAIPSDAGAPLPSP